MKFHQPIAVFLLAAACSFAAGAQYGISWTSSQVVPVVLVKPGIGGFVPMEGATIGNTWIKSDVKPVLIVKPGIGGFEPVDGMSIGNTFSKDAIIPVTLVQPDVAGRFSPLSISETAVPPASTPRTSDPAATLPPGIPSSILEAQISGDFGGWQGETIVQLTNGQIWKQEEYHYEYHYAFMPKVIIFKSGWGFKMKVEGTDQAVGVTRLK
jgi:hypothetical protein